MKQFIFLIPVAVLFSCSQKNTKQTGSTETETAVKDTTVPAKTERPDSTAGAPTDLVLKPLAVSGDIGFVTFTQKDKTVFYYDAKLKKGKISLNGVDHTLKLEFADKAYKLTGDGILITATEGKFDEMTSDCAYGKFKLVTVTMGSQVLKLNDVAVQDCSSMIE